MIIRPGVELANLTDTGLVGTGPEIVGQLQAYIDAGVSHFMLWFMDAPLTQGLRLFSEQVAPAFRASAHNSAARRIADVVKGR